MKSLYLLLLTFPFTLASVTSFGQCSGGSSFASVAAPTGTTAATISTCNWSGDYNTITSVVAGASYTLTATPSACITVHTGSPSGPVVAFGSGSVPFTAATSGTYYMVLTANCSGCASGSTCLTTTITCNSCAVGPCASISNITGCGQGYTLTTTGASSFISTLCATATPGLEQIYSYTATSTGSYSFNVTSVTGGGYVIGWKSSAGGCSATGWNCAGTATVPGSVGSISLTSGTTYYFVMDATSTAASGITFSLTCPAGGPTIAGDCNVAANVCSSASFSIDPNGFGAINEICAAGACAANPMINVSGTNSGCLLSGELNSTWMIVNVLTGGSLTFSLGTPSSGTTNCLDWAMWAYSPTTCANISAGTQAPVRCNYNGSCEEFTGIASALPTGASSMTNWEAPITVGSYTQYLICLSNYSSAITTVPLSFGGTAVVSCSPLGVETIQLSGKNESGHNTLEWISSSEYNAAKYIIERSENGVDFFEIGSVDAHGISLEALNYQFEDMQPILQDMGYYRVKLVRENGSVISSNAIAVEQQFMNDLELVKAFPNPATNDLNVILSSKMETSYQLTLSSLNGTKVFDSNKSVQKGLTYTSIDVSQFQNGFYFLTISLNGKNISTHKIIIE